ncbi:YciI family protein [Microlunatus ginsengisoli]|uniref:YCII-related domain-containing protein n=1 Tax=Microlunatus ginsengisoli TaxID=363863 RepID=A0ABP6ZTG9_9ACTN
MTFDEYVVVRLVRPPNWAPMAPEQEAATQDAHLAHLAELHDRGILLAAGPAGDPAGHVRGFAVLNCAAAEAEALMAEDPAVLAGRFVADCVGWSVPAGVLVAGPGTLPRSVADVLG